MNCTSRIMGQSMTTCRLLACGFITPANQPQQRTAASAAVEWPIRWWLSSRYFKCRSRSRIFKLARASIRKNRVPPTWSGRCSSKSVSQATIQPSGENCVHSGGLGTGRSTGAKGAKESVTRIRCNSWSQRGRLRYRGQRSVGESDLSTVLGQYAGAVEPGRTGRALGQYAGAVEPGRTGRAARERSTH